MSVVPTRTGAPVSGTRLPAASRSSISPPSIVAGSIWLPFDGRNLTSM